MFLLNRKTLALIGATAAAIGSTAFFAAPAQAASAGLAKVVGSKTVQFQALKGKANGVTITISGKTVTLTDKVAIKAGKGCKSVSSKKVRCKTSAKTASLRIALGDKNDWVKNKTSVYMFADGGTGNDTLYGGSAGEQLQGYSGNDKIYGYGGNDKLFGESGVDVISGGAGWDVLSGGSSNDKLYGDSGRDTLRGESGADLLSGGSEVDVAFGGSGDDWIYGGNGQYLDGTLIYGDTLYGEGGNDTIRGEGDTDIIEGGDGVDRLIGGDGMDEVLGNGGNDQIWGEGGDDVLAGDNFDYSTWPWQPVGSATAADAVNGGAHDSLGDFCLVTGTSSVTDCEDQTGSLARSSGTKQDRPEIRRAG
jgi:Ca2+-binding RTX toxin-like protein